MDFEKYLLKKSGLLNLSDKSTPPDSQEVSSKEQKQIEFYDKAMNYYRKSVPVIDLHVKLHKPKVSVLFYFKKAATIPALALAATILIGFFFVLNRTPQTQWQVSEIDTNQPEFTHPSSNMVENLEGMTYFEKEKFISGYIKPGSKVKFLSLDKIYLGQGEVLVHKVPGTKPFYLQAGEYLTLKVIGTTFKVHLSEDLIRVELFKGTLEISPEFKEPSSIKSENLSIQGYTLLEYSLGENGWSKSVRTKMDKTARDSFDYWKENNFGYSVDFIPKVFNSDSLDQTTTEPGSAGSRKQTRFKSLIFLKNGIRLECRILRLDTKYYYIVTKTGEKRVLKSEIQSVEY